MTREEAFTLSHEKNMPITHAYFTDDEYITVHLNSNTIIDENGYSCPVHEFMKWRLEKEWDSGWKFFDTTTKRI